MSTSVLEDAPRNVTPTDTVTPKRRGRKPRDPNAPKGAPKPKLTPGQLRMKADEMEKVARGRAVIRLEKARTLLGKAADAFDEIDAKRAASIRDVVAMLEWPE